MWAAILPGDQDGLDAACEGDEDDAAWVVALDEALGLSGSDDCGEGSPGEEDGVGLVVPELPRAPLSPVLPPPAARAMPSVDEHRRSAKRGAFTTTYKDSGYQARCPFHRRSEVTEYWVFGPHQAWPHCLHAALAAMESGLPPVCQAVYACGVGAK